MAHVPPVSGMTTSGPVVNPTSSSTESDYGHEQHGYCSDTEGQPQAPDLKPTEPR
jgi:hypothetical protein